MQQPSSNHLLRGHLLQRIVNSHVLLDTCFFGPLRRRWLVTFTTNKEKQEAFLARKKKLNEKNKETPPKPTKPTRRGKGAGLREIERRILRENKN